LKMGATLEPEQVAPPHLSKTQTLPGRSTNTALVAPQVLPSGSFAQFSTKWYGLGWATAFPLKIEIPVTMAIVRAILTRLVYGMMGPPRIGAHVECGFYCTPAAAEYVGGRAHGSAQADRELRLTIERGP
jgi:hypothetical protein